MESNVKYLAVRSSLHLTIIEISNSRCITIALTFTQVSLVAKMNHPPTLILPWGLKSWLVAVSRAVLLEEPPNVMAFIASYSGQLLQLKKEHPNLDIQELSYIFRDLRGGHTKDYQGTISFTGLAESVLIECSHKIPEERDNAAPGLSASDTSSSHVHCEEPGHQAMEDNAVSSSVVQCAVYQKDPSVCGVVDVENTVLIPRAPSEHVIIVHSECLPETLIFHSKALPSSNGSHTTCDLSPAPSPVPGDKEWEEPEGVSSVVMFYKVPLFEDLPHPPSMGELPSVAVVETVTDEDISSSSDTFPSQEKMSGTQSVQVFFSAAPEVESSGQMRNSTSSFEDLSVDKISDMIIPQKASSYKELPQSTSPIKQTSVVSPECSGSDITAKAPSETELVDAAQSAPSVRIPSREESVGRTAETAERYTSPRVSPRASPQTSLVSAHVGESSLPRIPSAPSMDRHPVSQRVSPQSSQSRIPSAPSMEELLVCPSASVGRNSPAVPRSSRSSLSERAPSETAVGRTAETREKHTSPRVPPQASSAVIDDQVTNPETSERLLTTSTLHSEDFKCECISFHNLAHGVTQTDESPASHGTTQTELSAWHRTTQTEKRPATHRTTQTEVSAFNGTAQIDERLALHGTTQTEEGPASSRTLPSASPLPGGAATEHQNPAEELGLGPSPAEDVTEVAEWVKPDNIETSKSSDLVSPQHVENAPIPELVSPQHVENAPTSRLAFPPHEEALTFENPQESVETEENVETSNVEVTSKPQPEYTTNAPPCPGPETPQMIQEESATQTPEEESVQEELTTQTPEEESVQEEITTQTPEEESVQEEQTTQTPEEESVQEELTTQTPEEESVQEELTTQTPEEESVQEELTTQTPEEESVQEELTTQTPEEESVQEELTTKTPEESFPRVPTLQFLLPVHTAEGCQQNRTKPANLIKMAVTERNHLIKRLAKSDPLKNRLDGSKSATGVREVSYATKLMKQRSQTAPQPNLKRMLSLTGGPTQEHSGQTAQTVRKLDTPDTQQIKIPNYLLVERSSGTSDTASSQERKPADQDSCVVSRGRCTGFLSFSVPIDSFCGAECGCRPQFLQITTDDGDVVYSPAFIQAINPCRPGADEVAERTDTRPTTSPAHMEWSFKISIKGQSVGDDEVNQEK